MNYENGINTIDNDDDHHHNNHYQVIKKMITSLNAQLNDVKNNNNNEECDDGNEQISKIIKNAEKLHITNSNGTKIKKLDIVRMILCMRYNALESGVYLYTAML